ncbi:MAG: ribonuclease J [Patescibacteria group bacterium]|nr:ribonuclease J [Patescibacteria group bacterium]
MTPKESRKTNYHNNGRGNYISNRSQKLKIIPIGGQGEVGKNMTAYEFGNDIIVVDMGIMFPDEDMLGIDFVIPDFKYLEENKHRIRGIIFTHGHEDHIGGVPYIWPKLNAPMFGTQLTAGLLEVKMKEFGINAKVNVVKPGEKLKLGVFELEFIHVTHSIPGAMAIAINTPEGKVLHLADWKIDYTPVNATPIDLSRFAQLGNEGVLALMSDSTNAEKPGYTISEQVVGETFDNIFKNAKSRIIITSFASQINRIQQVINSSIKYRRKIAFSGRSMVNNVERATKLGYLSAPQGTIVDIRRIGHIPDNELVVMCTGSQGEEYSALVRMASGEHKQVKIKYGDTVVISASPIPGNERSIYETVDNLFREGANVIYGKNVDVHVSGHASQEELKLMLSLIKPKYFIPMHGDYRFLIAHARLAQQVGLESKSILIAENGNVLEIGKDDAKILPQRIQSGYILVDGLGIGDVGNIVLRDRQAMAKDGIFVVILTVDHNNGKIITSPDIISRGFVYMRAREDLIQKSRMEVRKMFSYHNEKYPLNWDYIKRMVRDELGEFLYKETQRRPMVIPVIIEV